MPEPSERRPSVRRPTVALIVDHPQRDLAGIVLTGVQLCQQGVICHLVPHNLEDRELWALAPDLVLLNFFRPANEGLARKLMTAGIQVAVLDTEGGVWPTEEAYVELLWQDAKLRRQLECVCMWGPRLARHLVAREVLSSEQVVVTGCPRFDFYHPQWQPVMHQAGARSPARILINTNFSRGNPRFATVTQNVGQMRVASGLSEDRVAALIETERQAIDAVIELAQDLARDYPTTNIVFRPHPFESPDLYRQRLGENGRIVVDNDQPVQSEIRRASVVIQRSCSTAVEAGLAGVPALSPQLEPATVVNPTSEMVIVGCESYRDMRVQLDAIFGGTYEAPLEIREAIECVTRDWFCRADGMAHRRVSDAVVRRLGGARTVDERRCERSLYGLEQGGRLVPAGVGRALRYRLRLAADFAFSRMRRVPTQNKPGKSFSVGEVRALSDAIRRVGGTPAARPVRVTAARDDPRYRRQLLVHSITLACESDADITSGEQIT